MKSKTRENRSWYKVRDYVRLLEHDNPGTVVILLLGGFAKATPPFLSLYFSAAILNCLIAGQYEKALVTVIWLLGTQLIAGLVDKGCSQRLYLLQEAIEQQVKKELAQKAYVLEYEKFERQETMDSLKRANMSANGMGGMGYQVINLYDLITYCFSLVYSLVFLVMLLRQVPTGSKNFFTSNWSVVVLLLVFGLLIYCSGLLSEKVRTIFDYQSKQNDHNNTVSSYIGDLMLDAKNAKEIRIFDLKTLLLDKYSDLGTKGCKMYLDTGKETGFYMGLNSFLSQLAAGVSYIFIGAKALYGVIPIGNVLLYAGAINQAMTTVMKILPSYNEFMYRADFLGTFTDFLNQPSMSYDGTLPIEKRDDGEYEFEFHDVSFTYPETEITVLSHVNLKLVPGEKIALVGRNGAGKTTLVKLLCRLYEPTEGSITLNGIDIQKYQYQEYVQAFSVVFQDFNLFSLPLGENLTAGNPPDEKRLQHALEQVDLTERIGQMKDGIKSQLYHNNGDGIDISGGEAQRFAIARALYKDAPFVILDEPTAALDPISEAEIYEHFNQMVEHKTAIYISHRMSSCKFCSRIIVLDQGAIVEEGDHESLLSQNGIYASLYETQAQYYVTKSIA